jgi:hypothetical protein
MRILGAQEQITRTGTSWQSVRARPHRFGGMEYVIGKREIGRIHNDHLMDVPFSKRVRDESVNTGRAGPHHILPESG